MTELCRMFPENNPQRKLEDTFRYLNRITGKQLSTSHTFSLFELILFTGTVSQQLYRHSQLQYVKLIWCCVWMTAKWRDLGLSPSMEGLAYDSDHCPSDFTCGRVMETKWKLRMHIYWIISRLRNVLQWAQLTYKQCCLTTRFSVLKAETKFQNGYHFTGKIVC